MIMCFTWQSWGDHTDVAQAAVVYSLLLFTIFVYCLFGQELSDQVIIIWLLRTDYRNCLPSDLLLMSIPVTDLCFLELQQ